MKLVFLPYRIRIVHHVGSNHFVISIVLSRLIVDGASSYYLENKITNWFCTFLKIKIITEFFFQKNYFSKRIINNHAPTVSKNDRQREKLRKTTTKLVFISFTIILTSINERKVQIRNNLM